MCVDFTTTRRKCTYQIQYLCLERQASLRLEILPTKCK